MSMKDFRNLKIWEKAHSLTSIQSQRPISSARTVWVGKSDARWSASISIELLQVGKMLTSLLQKVQSERLTG
jgi:hypothetical protein